MVNRSTALLSALGIKALIKKKNNTVSIRHFGAILFTLILTGCAVKNGQSPLETLAQVVVPEVKVIDYRYASCDKIWGDAQPNSRENALFWLRLMDCADRVEVTQARLDANRMVVNNWSSAFQQNILLNSANPSVAERRKMLDSINKYSLSFPIAIRPLLQLWREEQVQIINLADAGARYKRLQQEMDTKLESLKEENAKLVFELNTTLRKLENLTEIERQLSSRKQSTNEAEKEAENAVEGEKPALQEAQKPVDTNNEQVEQNQSENVRNDKS